MDNQRVVEINIVFVLRGHSASECRCKYYVILFWNNVVGTASEACDVFSVNSGALTIVDSGTLLLIVLDKAYLWSSARWKPVQTKCRHNRAVGQSTF